MFGGKDKYYEYTENFWKKYLRNRSYLQNPELKVGEERERKGATHSWPSRSARNTQDRDLCSPDGVYFRPGMALRGRGSSGTARNAHVASSRPVPWEQC